MRSEAGNENAVYMIRRLSDSSVSPVPEKGKEREPLERGWGRGWLPGHDGRG